MSQLFYRISNRALFINLIKAFNESELSYTVDFSPVTDKNNLTILDDTETDIYVWNTEFNILKLYEVLKNFEYTGYDNYISVYDNIASVNIYFLLLSEYDTIKLKDISVPKNLINKSETINIKLFDENLKITRSVYWSELMQYKQQKKKSWWQLWGQ